MLAGGVPDEHIEEIPGESPQPWRLAAARSAGQHAGARKRRDPKRSYARSAPGDSFRGLEEDEISLGKQTELTPPFAQLYHRTLDLLQEISLGH